MFINALKNNYLKIFLLILFSLIVDTLFIKSLNSPPAWDQGYHLSNAFKMSNIFNSNNISFSNRILELLDVTDSYRGPITYLISGLFLKLFGNTYYFAYLSNNIFNAICILSLFQLGKILKNEATGLWAGIIFTFSSLIINQRSDYLIDLSITSFSTICLLFFTKWFLNYKSNKRLPILPILSGFSLGLVFLAKPTGIAFFILPIIVIFLKIFKNQTKFLAINQIILFLSVFIITIYPWFSRHWLTISTSTLNAWKWGINYQDGFGKDSFENWIYYFKKLPFIFGIVNTSIFSIIFILETFYNQNFSKFRIKNCNQINIWFSIFLLNGYLLVSFMSTKDTRFILPIYPILCIYLSKFINSSNNKIFKDINKKTIIIISMSLSLIFNNGLNLRDLNSNFLFYWPHREIINEIKINNPNLTTTLAILPDTKEINTFNLEAEASRQGENVSVRQIVSNKNSFKEDLKYFDWFLLKTGDQGVMTNDAKILLSEYLLENNSFITHKEWTLSDKSTLKLLKRESINSFLSKKECIHNSQNLKVNQIKNGLKINFSGKGKNIISSNLLINFAGDNFNMNTNISLANGSFPRDFNEKSCYDLEQRISTKFPKNVPEKLLISAKLLKNNGDIIQLKIDKEKFTIDEKLLDSDYIQMENRISKVESLGVYLRNGEYKKLFDLVGIINQSDPDQSYIEEAEKIYKQRYNENNDLKNLYSILISQILQRKILKAERTVDKILKLESDNGNAYLTKAIINIYLLNRKDARISIEEAKLAKKSLESKEILKIVQGINYLLEMKLINAYKTFSL